MNNFAGTYCRFGEVVVSVIGLLAAFRRFYNSYVIDRLV